MRDAKQEQLIVTRRNQILDAAARVFAEKGFHPTTIKDIARAAGIADGTIYIYFPNKPALLLGILTRMKESVQQEVDPAQLAGMDLHTFVRTYLHYPLTVFEASNFELFRVVLSEIMVNKEVREQYYQQILEPTIALAERSFQQWAEQNNVAPIHTTLMLHTISGLVLGLIVQRIMGDATLEAHWERLPDVLSDLLLNGIRSEHA
jgi:TetR/AcrR family fatty acid metabolism transcriptional regulator